VDISWPLTCPVALGTRNRHGELSSTSAVEPASVDGDGHQLMTGSGMNTASSSRAGVIGPDIPGRGDSTRPQNVAALSTGCPHNQVFGPLRDGFQFAPAFLRWIIGSPGRSGVFLSTCVRDEPFSLV
jgi:hypothetical protein